MMKKLPNVNITKCDITKRKNIRNPYCTLDVLERVPYCMIVTRNKNKINFIYYLCVETTHVLIFTNIITDDKILVFFFFIVLNSSFGETLSLNWGSAEVGFVLPILNNWGLAQDFFSPVAPLLGSLEVF
jgi:hypothetical protein